MSSEFRNRLLKNFRHVRKWAGKQQISCYRLYDLDIPSFPLCVDIYDGHVHVAEYKAAHHLSEEEHADWLGACLQDIAEVIQIDIDHIFLKLRERQRGLSQYERFSHESYGLWVQESDLDFWVNLTDYLDTGLFLDHRITRSMVRQEASGKRVLNLFSYTGSFSVYAAAGGASRVDTVDMSQTYLSWAEKNMRQNGFEDPTMYQYFREDILQWLPGPLKQYYDIIVLDPPTFSNSKKMRDILDIQQDHVALINLSLQALKPGGVMYFSNNFRRFEMEKETIKASAIKDISAQTIPMDFRNKQIHHCFKIWK
jgi:23S rRNA (cytosine1962-C5)-methyltransferase